MNELYELKETLCKELENYGRKGKLSAGDLDVVDKLTHTIKNLDKIIENYGDDYSGRRDSRGRYAREYSREPMRDYSNTRYSRHGNMVSELKELMEDAPDERTRMEFENFIRKMEKM